MRLGIVSIAAATLLAGQAARAEVSATLGLFSDYDFRGISQTEGDPAVQGSLDYAGNLFYIGAWGSNVDFGDEVDGNTELDIYAGFAKEYESGWSWDVGTVWYYYPGSQESETQSEIADYWEVYVGAGWDPASIPVAFDVKYWYSPDLYDVGETANYVEGNVSIDLPWELGLGLHAGYSSGDAFDAFEEGSDDDADYIDYSVSLTRSFGHFDFEVKYVATDLDGDFEVTSGPNRNDERVIASVSTTWPWSDEE